MTRFISFLLLFGLGCSDFTKDKEANTPEQKKVEPTTQGTPPPLQEVETFSLPAMIRNIGSKIMAGRIRNFHSEMKNLESAVKQSLLSNDSRLASAQWEKTMLSFHQVKSVPVGPLAELDAIYYFPYLNRCFLDRLVIQYKQGQITDFSKLKNNEKGLFALEYLLFEPTLVSKCHTRAYPKTKAWSELADDIKKADRLALVGPLVQQMIPVTDKLSTDWSGFVARWAADPKSEKLLTDAAFSALELVKENSLGIPLGLHSECYEESCPEDSEHPYAGLSLSAIESHMAGLSRLFEDGQGFNLRDRLLDIGRKVELERFLNQIKLVELELRENNKRGPMPEQIKAMDTALCKKSTRTQKLEPLCSMYDEIRELSKLFRNQILVALKLTAPSSFQGDND